jgi:hypothetical protein
MKTAFFGFLALFASLASTQATAQNLPTASTAKIPPGLYVSVTDGQIVLANKGGTTNFTAGQFGFTPSVTQPPVLIPKNPAIQFTPPVFNSTTTTQSSASPKSNSVDCIVR